MPKKKGKGKGKSKTVEEPLKLLDFDPAKSKKERLQELFNKWYNCSKCPLAAERNSRVDGGNPEIVFGEGNPDAHVLIVGEAPGEDEERTSIPFVGNSGQLLNQILVMTSEDPEVRKSHEEYSQIKKRSSKAGTQALNKYHEAWVDWRNENFFVTNTVACRPEENRTPNNNEVKACWERLWNIIYIMDPLVIIGAGNSAMSALLQKVQVQISKMRGNVYDAIYDGILGKVTYPTIPIFHPSYLLRKADWNSTGGDFDKTVEDVRKAMRLVDFLRQQHFGTPIPSR